MLIPQDDGTALAGPADIICILQLPDGRFHVAFFEENPFPGPITPLAEVETIRLKSKMHHTAGADDLAGAQKHLDELRKHYIVDDKNVIRDIPIPVADPVNVWVVRNWTTGNISLTEALTARI